MRVLSTVLIALASIATTVHTPAQAEGTLVCGQKYSVAPGDSISKIARRAYGENHAAQLYAANRSVIGRNHNRLLVGTVLTIPCLDDRRGNTAKTAVKLTQPAAEPATRSDAATTTHAQDATPPRTAGVTSKTLAADPDQIVEIVFNKSSAPEFILNVGIINPLFEDITRATSGRVRFVDPPVVNRDPRIQMDLVLSRHVDGAYIFNGYLSDQRPLLQITMAPMMGGTAQQTAMALWRTHQNHLADTGQFNGLKLFGFVGAPSAHIWHVSEESVAGGQQSVDNQAWSAPDIQQHGSDSTLRVRAAASGQMQPADETQTPAPAAMALTYAAARTMGVWKKAISVVEVDGGVYAPTFSVFIHEDKWAKISPRDRAVIEKMLGESLAMRSAAWDAFDNGHKKAMLKQGLKVEQADLELLATLQDRARLVWEAWIADADRAGISGYSAIEAFFAEMEKLRQQYPSGTGVQS